MADADLMRINDLLDWLRAMPSATNMAYELRRMQAIREWCLSAVGFTVGDKVVLLAAPDTDNGWRSYAECLVVGATATVMKIDFNLYSDGGRGAWVADVVLDREWSTSSTPSLGPWWHGPVDETPDGMQAPSAYDQENYPNGRRHQFGLWVGDLAKVRENRSGAREGFNKGSNKGSTMTKESDNG